MAGMSMADLNLDEVIRSIPKNQMDGARAVYEACRTDMGLVRLRPWDDLLTEERLMYCTFIAMGANLDRRIMRDMSIRRVRK